MKILVSACLMGDNCKYNGGNNLNEKLIEISKIHQIYKVCPELLAKMGVPRISVEVKNGRIINKNGEDVHDIYEMGIDLAMERIPKDVDLVVLQSRSPTCGVKQIYNGDFNKTLINGQGLFAKRLLEHGYKVIDVEDVVTYFEK